MKTPTDFLRALAARVGLLKDHNRPIHREARLHLALGGEIRFESAIQAILKKTPPEDQAAMRRILGVGSIFLALLVTPTGEASPTDPHPRATGSVSTTERARGTGGSAGAVIVSLPRTTRPSGQFRHGASAVVPQRVIGSRVLRSVPFGFSGKQKSPEIGVPRNGGAYEVLNQAQNKPASQYREGVGRSISGPRVRNPGMRGTFGENLVVDCCARRAGGTKTLRAYYTQASWYGSECEGYPMADGRPFKPDALTCASWFHPLGSRLRVSAGGRFVVVTVTDRGPAMDLVRDGRGIDLSREAFRRLATLESGLVMVKLEEL